MRGVDAAMAVLGTVGAVAMGLLAHGLRSRGLEPAAVVCECLCLVGGIGAGESATAAVRELARGRS